MRSLMFVTSFVVAVPMLASCGQAPVEPSSEVMVDLDLPKDQIDPTEIQKLLGAFGGYVQEGVTQVSLADFANSIDARGGFKTLLDDIVKSRQTNVDVSCVGRRCQFVTSGQDYSFKLDSVKIPVLGSPTIILGQRVEIFAELTEDLQRFYACRINGVKVKTGFLTPSIDGLLLELAGPILNTIQIDAGPGGAYPNDGCRS